MRFAKEAYKIADFFLAEKTLKKAYVDGVYMREIQQNYAN